METYFEIQEITTGTLRAMLVPNQDIRGGPG